MNLFIDVIISRLIDEENGLSNSHWVMNVLFKNQEVVNCPILW
jgi:hypothetical protein